MRTRDLENDLQGLRKCLIQGNFSQVKGSGLLEPESERLGATPGPPVSVLDRRVSERGLFAKAEPPTEEHRRNTGDLMDQCMRLLGAVFRAELKIINGRTDF